MSVFSLVLNTIASLAISQTPNDNRIYLEPDTLKGQWVRTKDLRDPSNPEWYQRIRYVYKIGIDTIPEYNYPVHTRLMTISVVYPATVMSPSFSAIGYFYDWKSEGDYKNDIAYLVCKYIPDNQNRSQSLVIKFAMPSIDSLVVVIADPVLRQTETFGLKRRTF